MPSFAKRYYNYTGNPTTVSRDVPPGEYSWDTVVYQSGRPVLDAELNLTQEAAEYARLLLGTKTVSSGFLRGQSTRDSLQDYFYFPAPVPGDENKLGVRKQIAWVAGMPVVVEYTNTATPGDNVIELPVPSQSTGIAATDIKRTDFVFLEVWRTLVAPSPRAFSTVTVATPANPNAITIDVTVVAGAPTAVTLTTGVDFAVGGNNIITATNLATAINANPTLSLYVAAANSGTSTVTITTLGGGAIGNGIILSSTNTATLSPPGGLSPVLFTGGADRLNKPLPAGTYQGDVYRHGNVESDPTTWLPDELVDPVLNSESAQRVQVQYRLRVYGASLPSGVNPKTEPDGFSNGSLYAQGAQGAPVATYPFVPADNSTVSANSDSTAYGIVDPGLQIAGDGTQASANALGTVDGFVYAIPVCFVFRRSEYTTPLLGGFSPAQGANAGPLYAHVGFNNTNIDVTGAAFPIAAGASDRPDGLFADVIVPSDVLDLRRHVTPPGYDFGSELKYQLQSLLDKKTATWQVDGSDWSSIGNGSGDQSTFPLFCDEIGRENAQGGNPANGSGDTFRGTTIRNFDHVSRRFGSQSVVERIVFEVYPNVPPPTGITVTKAAGVKWYEGDQVAIDFTTLNPTTTPDWVTPSLAVANVANFWPTGTLITDVLSVYHDDGNSTVNVAQETQVSFVSGIGTSAVTLTLDANPTTVDEGGLAVAHPMVGDAGSGDVGSPRRIFIELEITYPTGFGLTQTPDVQVIPDPASGYPGYIAGPIVENNVTQRPVNPTGGMKTDWIPAPKMRPGYRETRLDQKTATGAPNTAVVSDTLVTSSSNILRTPRRFFFDSMLANGAAPAAGTTYGSSERLVNLAVPTTGGFQEAVAVDYYPQDPVPNWGGAGGGYQVAVYYRTQAPQTAGTQAGSLPATLLPTELIVEPVAISPEIWTGQTGKGSPDLAYPYESPLDPIPVSTGLPVVGTPREWYFSALSEVTVSDFSAATGLLSLHSFVQVDGTNPVQLGDSPGRGPVKDPEFRAYYDFANPGGYKPTAMAQPLFGATRHKAFTPMLVRSTVDTRLFRKGELLLLVLSQFHELSADNKITFVDNPALPPPPTARTSAAIYRTRNLLLTVGD